MTNYQGPSWDNTSEYLSLDAPELIEDIEKATKLTIDLEETSSKVSDCLASMESLSGDQGGEIVSYCKKATLLLNKAKVLLFNVETYASCCASVDGSDLDAKELINKTEQLYSKLVQTYKPVGLFLQTCPDHLAADFLSDENMQFEKFSLEQSRKHRKRLLPLGEETLLLEMDLSGKNGFGNLYTDISTSIKVDIDGKKMGLAAASLILESKSESERKAAYLAINDGWRKHEESCAAILNNITGWRISEAKRRSHTESVHFLDASTHDGCLSHKTLETMFSSVAAKKQDVQKSLKLKAQMLGKEVMAPWDAFAPSPSLSLEACESKYTFNEAITLIKDALGGVDGSMADFIDLMVSNKWIEGSVGDHKRPGAYCTKFFKSRSPRVYMSYAGGMKDVMTLAHELGHAYHNWVMRDLPISATAYPMTLAETASIFSETVVHDHLMANAKNDFDKLQCGWVDVLKAESFLLNIPVRFDFEVAINEERGEKSLNASGLKKLMTRMWDRWYGDAMSEANEMFWASKLHFSIPSLSFYNFPYTFGYLFALGVYAERENLGGRFHKAYVDLLRDTGTMTCEQVAEKHLGVDIEKNLFWDSSVDMVMKKLTDFERVSEELVR